MESASTPAVADTISVTSTLTRWTDPASPEAVAAAASARPKPLAPSNRSSSNAQPFTATDVVTFALRANTTALLAADTHAVVQIDLRTDKRWDRIAECPIPLASILLGDKRVNPKPKSRGSFVLPMYRSGSGSGGSGSGSGSHISCGDVYGDMLLVEAWNNPLNDLSRVYRNYWSRRMTARDRAAINSGSGSDEKRESENESSGYRTLDMGHRGLGRSFRKLSGQRKPSIVENSILSLSAAAHSGAEFIELDVMLTRDRVPVVFHDFGLGVYTAPSEDGSMCPPPLPSTAPAGVGIAGTTGGAAAAAANLSVGAVTAADDHKLPAGIRFLTMSHIRNSKVGWAYGPPPKKQVPLNGMC